MPGTGEALWARVRFGPVLGAISATGFPAVPGGIP